MIALSVVAVTLSLSGCSSAPAASPSPTSSPGRAIGPGGYDDLAQACAGVADDLITFRTIRGSVEVGLDREGGEAILEELEERQALAPQSLTRSYRSAKAAIEGLIAEIDASPTRAPSGTASPAFPSARETTATPAPRVGASVPDLIDSSADDLNTWLRSNCAGV